jgi:trans-aconitate methyltransferase
MARPPSTAPVNKGFRAPWSTLPQAERSKNREPEKSVFRRPSFEGTFLDIGCASGSFILLMNTHFKKANFTGIDISKDLIDLAKQRVKNYSNVNFIPADAISYNPNCKFDIIHAAGILGGSFNSFKEPLDHWLSMLNQNGVLYLFGAFNSKNIDVVVYFRNNYNNSNWQKGQCAYSINTVSSYLDSLGFNSKFKRFHLSQDIHESDDPVKTFT